MVITKAVETGKTVVALEGRLDTTTAPELEAALSEVSKEDVLVLDLEKLEYISSAGLRVLLQQKKDRPENDSFVLTNVGADVKEILDLTGFSDILNIQ